MSRASRDLVLRNVGPNLGVTAAYRKRLDDLIKQMNESVIYWLRSSYRANQPAIMAADEIARQNWASSYSPCDIDPGLINTNSPEPVVWLAQDATPANELQRMVRELKRRWLKKFNELAPRLAEHFTDGATKATDAVLRKALRDAGVTVKFKMTAAQRDIIDATVHQNVSLIKSIPEKYFTDVEGAVMRSVQAGRDAYQLTNDLEKNYGVTRRRAALIARDQNQKATSALNVSRQKEIGITEAIWKHSHAGKEPRPTHLRNDGKRYDIATGWFDPDVGEYIWPGQLINCRCTSKSIIPGF